MAALRAAVLLVALLVAVAVPAAANYAPRKPFINVSGKTYNVSRELIRGYKVPFIKHEDGLPFGSYLLLNLNFAYALDIFNQINATQGPLLNRGEAHVTIISPIEYAVLAPYVNISEITAIALKYKIQEAGMDLICIGRAYKTTVENGVSIYQEVYFVKIHTCETIDNIRYAIQQLFISRGGNGALFDYAQFLPHITIGFLHHDLFIEDGIYKGDNSCWANILRTEARFPNIQV